MAHGLLLLRESVGPEIASPRAPEKRGEGLRSRACDADNAEDQTRPPS